MNLRQAFTRRDFLRLALLFGGTAILSPLLKACGGSTPTATPTQSGLPTPTNTFPSPTLTLQTGPSSAIDTPITLDTVARIACLRKLVGHDNRLYGLDFSPDGRFFGSYSLDGIVQLWDPVTWQVVQEFTDSNATGWRLFFLADSSHISSGSGTVWDIATGEVEHVLSRGHRVAFSPDGIWMADNGGQRGIALWRIAGWQLEREIVTSHTGDHLAFSSDNRLLASSGYDFNVKLLDVIAGQEVYTLQGHQNIIHGLAFSPNANWLATASMDETVKIWDVQTGQLLHTLQTAAELFDVAFSPDGSLVAAALNNKTVELWDVANAVLVGTLDHGGEVVSVTFSPDGLLLASGAYDMKVYHWYIPPLTT